MSQLPKVCKDAFDRVVLTGPRGDGQFIQAGLEAALTAYDSEYVEPMVELLRHFRRKHETVEDCLCTECIESQAIDTALTKWQNRGKE